MLRILEETGSRRCIAEEIRPDRTDPDYERQDVVRDRGRERFTRAGDDDLIRDRTAVSSAMSSASCSPPWICPSLKNSPVPPIALDGPACRRRLRHRTLDGRVAMDIACRAFHGEDFLERALPLSAAQPVLPHRAADRTHQPGPHGRAAVSRRPKTTPMSSRSSPDGTEEWLAALGPATRRSWLGRRLRCSHAASSIVRSTASGGFSLLSQPMHLRVCLLRTQHNQHRRLGRSTQQQSRCEFRRSEL
jgi:hypothetical protein